MSSSSSHGSTLWSPAQASGSRSPWRSAVAFWSMAVVSLTFYVEKWIGQDMWRSIHHLSFGVFVAAAGHGILAGTDTTHPVAIGAYVGSIAAVLLLTVIRVIGSRQPSRARTERPSRQTGPLRQGADI